LAEQSGIALVDNKLAQWLESGKSENISKVIDSDTGEPLHWSEEGARNFWRWFGDSNVVDAQGRPCLNWKVRFSSISIRCHPILLALCSRTITI